MTYAAGIIGNVARPVASGKFSLGIDYEDFKQEVSETLTVTCPNCNPTTITASDSEKLEFSAPSVVAAYALPDSPVEIGGLFGNVTVKPESGSDFTGTKTGAFVRYARQNADAVNFGLSVKYETASVSGSNYTGSYTATTFAFGVGKEINPSATLFGGIFGNQISGSFDATDSNLRQAEAELGVPRGTITGATIKISEKSSLGGFAGAEVGLQEGFVVGVELHAMNESGLGIYARFAL
jgi:hypothetical protein